MNAHHPRRHSKRRTISNKRRNLAALIDHQQQVKGTSQQESTLAARTLMARTLAETTQPASAELHNKRRTLAARTSAHQAKEPLQPEPPRTKRNPHKTTAQNLRGPS
ncbi:hypothetical protein SETIT_4G173500v2 [Setaria italica]|uniref:Uncharacterized protein n=1 Tax=Setaria italica TaxID=4555 RepID=A0A368QVM9_SETIT|nr:hypothetical protein SETIT_4G173500v2 [Setaria italica]